MARTDHAPMPGNPEDFARLFPAPDPVVKDRARRRFLESLPEIRARIEARRAEGWPCLCNHIEGHGDPHPLTTEEARGLAQRRAYWHEQKPWLGSPALEKIANEVAAESNLPRLTDAGRERLFAWVLAWLEENGSRSRPMSIYASCVELAIVLRLADDAAGRALAKAAGWPS